MVCTCKFGCTVQTTDLLVDEELVLVRQSSSTGGWVNIGEAKQYQQETYVSLVRLRKGSRLSVYR
jgi:hypothetical protein